MPQIAALVQTLKAALKGQRKTYADVAEVLGLTEASVKRLFSEQDFTLERLEAICQMLGMELSDLVQKMNESRHRLERLTPQQEREIAEDLLLVVVMVCVFNRWTVKEITAFYAISETQCVAKLLKLDQLKIIELLPGNRIKLLISPNFKWLENGPIQQFFRENIGREFFDTGFQREDECLLVLNGMLSGQSNAEFQRRLERMAKEFNELNDEDAGLPLTERKGVTLVLALRNWEYGLLRHLTRKPEA
jgi:DNA-binding Xre family transcriptional regulator